MSDKPDFQGSLTIGAADLDTGMRPISYYGDVEVMLLPLLLERSIGGDRLSREFANALKRGSKDWAPAIVTRFVASLLAGGNVNPIVREMFARALISGEFKLELKRCRKGQPTAALKEQEIVQFLREKLAHLRPTAAYRAAADEFELKPRRIMKIAQEARVRGALK
jgi:hypothetical protein